MSTCSRLRALLSSTVLAGVHPASCASLVALAALAAAPVPAWADTDWTGAVSTDWFNAGNWTNGVPDGGDDVAINTVTPNPTVVSGAVATARFLSVGDGIVGIGQLTIQGGGVLNSQFGSIGQAANSNAIGTVTVTGAGSRWANSEGLIVGSGTLTIANGGTVTNTDASVGGNTGATPATVTVTGAGSQWTNSGFLAVAETGRGTLIVANGGTVSSSSGRLGLVGTGTAMVIGAGSQWTSSGEIAIGIGSNISTGTGTLTIADGGSVSASGIAIAVNANSIGTVNIGAATGQAPLAPGTLNTPTVTFGAGSGTLNFNHTSGAYTFAPLIGGSGEVNVHAGTTILTAANTYTGPTNVNGGMLLVNGSIAGSVAVVNAGGTIGGSGALGETLINGGTLSPGAVNAIGTTAVAGNLAFSSAATYLVQVTPSAADSTNVTGAATLGGTLRVVAAPGNYAPGTTYTILNATGGISGAFDGVSGGVFLIPTLSYDTNNVFLTLALASFTSVAQTPNQIATAGGVQSLGFGNPVFDAVLALGSAGEARAAFDRLSGEVHASAAGVMLDESRHVRDAVLVRARQAYGSAPAVLAALGPTLPEVAYAAATAPVYKAAPAAPAANERVYATWGQAIGTWGRSDSDGNAASLDRKAAGVITGVDATFADRWRLGVAGGYTRTSLAVDARASSAGIDSTHIALYGGGQFGDGQLGGARGVWGLRGGGAFTWHEISTNRSIVFPGFADRTHADYDAHSAQVFGEIGYSIIAGRAAVEPFAAVAYVNLDHGGFNENGGAAALTAREQSLATTFTTLGLRAATVVGVSNGTTVTARGTLGWRHAFGDVTPALAFSFASGGVPFTIAGVPIAKDSALVEAGLDLDVTSRAKLGIGYSGQLAGNAQDHAVKGNFLWKF
jgi:outer membrane autotransporter protein